MVVNSRACCDVLGVQNTPRVSWRPFLPPKTGHSTPKKKIPRSARTTGLPPPPPITLDSPQNTECLLKLNSTGQGYDVTCVLPVVISSSLGYVYRQWHCILRRKAYILQFTHDDMHTCSVIYQSKDLYVVNI